jgi:Na+/H+ antiporter NhaD/arsenite permease-like protein
MSLALLFPIADAVDETGFLDLAMSRVLGRPDSLSGAILRLMLPTAMLSGFLNNTPLVAMMLPVARNWSNFLGHDVGKLLMPLSFGAQLGGCLTIMGSSTTLTAKDAVKSYYDMRFFFTLHTCCLSAGRYICSICSARTFAFEKLTEAQRENYRKASM